MKSFSYKVAAKTLIIEFLCTFGIIHCYRRIIFIQDKYIIRGMKQNCAKIVISTYLRSICMNFISMECIDVKTLVAPCTTHSRVSGIATGVHVAMNTGSFREHSGRYEIYRP